MPELQSDSRSCNGRHFGEACRRIQFSLLGSSFSSENGFQVLSFLFLAMIRSKEFIFRLLYKRQRENVITFVLEMTQGPRVSVKTKA